MTLRDEAARALDQTHGIGERGPKTMQARMLVAGWLDGKTAPERKVKAAVKWLLGLGAKRYSVKLRSVGNPDFDQYRPISSPKTFEADTLEEISAACRAYIEKWDLGGGNWPGCVIREDGVAIGYVSYNGRVWRGKPGLKGEEILLQRRDPQGLTWTEHVRICVDCKRPFRVSQEALADSDLDNIASCIACVAGHEEPGERVCYCPDLQKTYPDGKCDFCTGLRSIAPLPEVRA